MHKVKGKGPLPEAFPTSPKCRAILTLLSNVIRRPNVGSSRGLLFPSFPAINWVTLIKYCR